MAALRLQFLEDWVIADATRLQVDDYTPRRLSLDSIGKLESLAKTHFEETVLELVENVLAPPGGLPLDFLSGFLKKESQ